MALNKLNAIKYLQRIMPTKLLQNKTIVPVITRFYNNKSPTNLDDMPIKFSTSDAVYGIQDVRHKDLSNEPPWYQGYIVTASVAVFLIYFCMIREENDIDIKLGQNLYDQVEGLEETNLKVARKFYWDKGDLGEVAKIDGRLKELGIPI